MDRSAPLRSAPAAAADLRLFDEADRGDTKAKILEAAFRRLATEGYAALSVR
jgi:AcrR family transcriptional regulator